jgi:hypothetical protein
VMGILDEAFALEDNGIDQSGGDPGGSVLTPGVKNVNRVPSPMRLPCEGSTC